jgi:flagellar assembly protein FliH
MEKFLFNTEFFSDRQRAEDEKAKKPPPPPPPQYSEEELAQARRDALVAGREQGLREALDASEQAAARACETIAAHMTDLAKLLDTFHERQDRELVETAFLVVRKIFPELARRHALAETEGVIAECLSHLCDEPRVVIRVADSLLDALTERLQALAAGCGFEGRLVLLSDAELGPSDVRVEWADGGAERDCGRIWRNMDEILARIKGPDDGARDSEPNPAEDPPPNDSSQPDDALADAGDEALPEAADEPPEPPRPDPADAATVPLIQTA